MKPLVESLIILREHISERWDKSSLPGLCKAASCIPRTKLSPGHARDISKYLYLALPRTMYGISNDPDAALAYCWPPFALSPRLEWLDKEIALEPVLYPSPLGKHPYPYMLKYNKVEPVRVISGFRCPGCGIVGEDRSMISRTESTFQPGPADPCYTWDEVHKCRYCEMIFVVENGT